MKPHNCTQQHTLPLHPIKPPPCNNHSNHPFNTAPLLCNNTCTYTTLWTPNALQHCYLTQTMETDQFPPHPNPVHSPSLIKPMTLTCTNNTPTDKHNTCTHTSAKITPPPWPAACQHHLQHPLHTTLATNMKTFAKNMQPP